MIEAGDKFCTSCGFKFTEQVATQQQPAQENQPVQPAQQQTQPVQQQAPQQPVQQNNENMEKLKSNSKSYWNWLVTSLKNPGSDQKADSKWYGVLTIVLEAVIPLGLLYFSLNSAISKFGNFSSQIADTVGSIIFGLLIFSIATKLIEILISYYMNNMLFTEKYTKRISYLDYVTKIMNKSGLCVVTCAIVSATVLFTGSKLSDFLTSQNLISSIFNPSEAIQSIIGFATGVGFFIAIPKFIGDIAVLVSCFHEIFTAEGNLKKNRIIVAWLFAIVLLVVDILIICMFLPSASK
ncbi:hypothetical protein FC23_GL000523 [Lactobacillus psittaci DSM 15354]|uniref:Uncharacterized protein n=2 Tax=Lactobacillus psittaci TaxID=116089 RepID=A0A0R1S526_9LACO|nr:hypothetical protein FC23_GL000523 [Lactobacillus psittaci DSM 15354]